ncbi:MipA/OmpV family protein [Sulfurimonas sp.]
MRYIVLLLLLLVSLNAQDKKQKITLGFGPYIQSQPYKDVNDLLLPSPVIFYDNGIFYVRWSRFGLYFLGEKTSEYAWGFSLTAQPRTLGYEPSDSSTLTGMQTRESSFEGGLAFSASYHDKEYIEVMFLNDLLNRYNSWILRCEIGDEFQLGVFKFYPSIVGIYQTDKFLNYYYGVKDSEATISRPAYTPSDGLEFGVQTYISYPFTQDLSALINLRYDILAQSAQDSPIVKDNYIYSGLVSLIYTFEY